MMITLVFCFGLLIGSFLGVVIDRLPRKESIVYGRSHCDACGTDLKPLDLIPLLSFAVSRGSCRYCRSRLSFRYPLIELLTAFSFAFYFVVFGLSFPFYLGMVLASLLLIVAFIDMDTMIINDRFHIILIALAVVEIAVMGSSIASHLIGALIISVPFLIIALVSQGLGGGDIKLMASAGLLLGYRRIFVAFIIASLWGGMYALYALLSQKASGKTAIPFGPFLCFGILVAYALGNVLLAWYLGLF